MADTAYDLAVEGREEYLGATEKGFIDYLVCEGHTEFPEWFLHALLQANDRDMINLLKDRFWNDYLDGLDEPR